jgi:hypothetical protein
MTFTIIILGFVTSLLTVFTLCMIVTRKLVQVKANLKAQIKLRHQQEREMQRASDAAWRGNQQMVMD